MRCVHFLRERDGPKSVRYGLNQHIEQLHHTASPAGCKHILLFVLESLEQFGKIGSRGKSKAILADGDRSFRASPGVNSLQPTSMPRGQHRCGHLCLVAHLAIAAHVAPDLLPCLKRGLSNHSRCFCQYPQPPAALAALLSHPLALGLLLEIPAHRRGQPSLLLIRLRLMA